MMDKVSQIANVYNKITQAFDITQQIIGLEPLKIDGAMRLP